MDVIQVNSFWIYFLIFMILCPSLCLSKEHHMEIRLEAIEGHNAVIRFEDNLTNLAKSLLNKYPDIKYELEKTIGWRIDFSPLIILIKDSSTFCRIAGSENFVAFAQPIQNLIVIDASKIAIKPFSQEIILKHELCHLLLHRYVPINSMPKWLDEGVCQWVTGGIGEILQEKRPSLNNAVLSGALLTFDDLRERFPKDKPSLNIAYEQSRNIIEFIESTYGTDKIIEILTYMQDGESFENAFKKSISITFKDFEKKWRASFSPYLFWLLFFSQNIYEIIFFVTAIITILAFLKYIIKRRRDAQYQDE